MKRRKNIYQDAADKEMLTVEVPEEPELCSQ